MSQKTTPTFNRTPDQHDACAIAEWMRRTDLEGNLAKFFKPELAEFERTLEEISADILAIEKEAEGLLDGLLKAGQR